MGKFNYHSQRSWGKVIYSQASVILSMGGVPAPGGLLLGGAWSGGCLLPGVCSQRGVWSWGCLLPGGACPQGGLLPGGLLPGGGVPGLGGCLVPGGCLLETPRDGYCCGWYASYWNAFLFQMTLLHYTICMVFALYQ